MKAPAQHGRRLSVRVFAWLVLAFVPLRAGEALPQPAALASGVEVIQTTVSDLDRALAFYAHVLSFEKVSDEEVSGDAYEHLEGVFGLRVRIVRMRLGDEFIELSEYLAPRGRPIPVDARSNDQAFQHVAIIVRDMDKAYAWLRQNKVEHASSGPQRLPDWNRNAAGIRAFYFKDPDGHPLEILQFPPDKGDPKWRRATSKLFLGIDHTALVTFDSAASLRFYRDLLGMRVAGESENYGTEQEHLNNVFGAHLHITSLRSASGPGIELLEYLAPREGRPFPADERANDVLHRTTVVTTPDAAAAAQRMRAAGVRFVSPGVVKVGQKQVFVVRDPDGHAVEVEAGR